MAVVRIETIKEITEYVDIEVNDKDYDSVKDVMDEIASKGRNKFEDYNVVETGEYDDTIVILKRVFCEDENSKLEDEDGAWPEDRYDIVI